MDDIDRNKILDNINVLLKITNYYSLMKLCLDKKILTLLMSENIDNSSTSLSQKHRNLLQKITHRGPTAFLSLLCCLYELKHFQLIFILLNYNSNLL